MRRLHLRRQRQDPHGSQVLVVQLGGSLEGAEVPGRGLCGKCPLGTSDTLEPPGRVLAPVGSGLETHAVRKCWGAAFSSV